ncbi:MAG: flavin-containing monooxygenase [Mesorhizobium sp.]
MNLSFDRSEARAALSQADITMAFVALAQLTGDRDLLERGRRHVRPVREFANEFPAELKDEIIERLGRMLEDGSAFEAPIPEDDFLRELMNTCAGQVIPDNYFPMLMEILGFRDRRKGFQAGLPIVSAKRQKGFHVVIVGAGLSGICAAIYLQRAGISYQLIDKNAGVGGTWFENHYPGCGVDTANHWYAYSFEPNPDWSRYFARRSEVFAYLNHCVDKYGVRENTLLSTTVEALVYDDERKLWSVSMRGADGTLAMTEANAVVTALGQLNLPKIPNLKGADTFSGPSFHTARWDHDHDYRGKRVAVVGTGSSGMQVGPTIAPYVKHLTIFQRSPHWVTIRNNYHSSVSDGMKWALRHVPSYMEWYRFFLTWAYCDALYPALIKDPEWNSPLSISPLNETIRNDWTAYIKRRLGDRQDLLPKVLPDYPPFGKRPVMDNHWFEMLRRDNVSLVASGIDRVEPDGIIADDGTFHAADMLVYATGFKTTEILANIHIQGRGGIDLRSVWGADDARAYFGITMPQFPNFFMMYGPNTNYGHGGSISFNAERQSLYILSCLNHLAENDYAALECRPSVFEAFNARLDEQMTRMVWVQGDMTNWYKNKAGRVTVNYPWTLRDYWDCTQAINPDDYIFSRVNRLRTGVVDREFSAT